MNSRLLGAMSASATLCAFLAGCTVGPNYRAPGITALGVPVTFAAPATPGEPADLAAWWGGFNDPLLTQLIAQATVSNLDIAESAARLVQVREQLVQARGAQLPAVTGSGGATKNFTRGNSSSVVIGSGNPSTGGSVVTTGGSSSSTQLSLGLDASWQTDLFGGLRRSIEAAQANEAGSRFDLEGVRTSVAGEVATNYVQARLAQARLAIARDTLKTQDDNLQIARWRVEAGLVSSLDVEQARVQRAQTASSISSLQTNLVNSTNRIGVLTGQAPGALRQTMAATGPIPHGPDPPDPRHPRRHPAPPARCARR